MSSLRVAQRGEPTGSEHDHLVQFYTDEEQLFSVVTDFLAGGLEAGEPLVVIAIESHRNGFVACLREKGLDPTSAMATGQLTLLDARETLAKLMVGSMPDWARFKSTIEAVLESVERPGKKLRAYGEMVDLLWRDGNEEAAIRLEEMWNDLQTQRSFSLLCAYVMASFYKEPSGLHRVCSTHSHVVDGRNTTPSVEWASPQGLAREIAHRHQVERALRESLRELRRKEAHLCDFVDNAAVGLHWVDSRGIIIWANRAELEMLGYDESEYVGRNIADFHADEGTINSILHALKANEVLQDREARLLAKDGSIKHVLISSNVYWEDGKFVHTRCFTRDVTSKKQTELLLDKSEKRAADRTGRLIKITAAMADAVSAEEVHTAVVDRVADAMKASSAGLFLIRENGCVELVRSVGYTADSQAALRMVPIDTPQTIPALDALRTGEPLWINSQQDMLARYPHLASMVSPQRSYCIGCLPLRSQDRILGTLAFTFDDEPIDDEQRQFLMLVARYSAQALERLRIVERERESRTNAELLHTLAASVIQANRVRDVFDSALDGIERALGAKRSSILVYDPDDVMRFKAWRGLSDGYRAAVEGHSPWPRDAFAPQPIVVPDVESDPAWSAYLPLFQSEQIRALAFIPLMASGRLIGKFMVYYGEPRTISASELDMAGAIGNHVAAGISRFTALESLKETVRFNEIFTGMLGHDLRNPLGAIMTAAQLVMSRDDNARVHGPLSRIIKSGERMARMIDQLLDFTRLRVGSGMPIARATADLAVTVRSVIDELEAANPARRVRLEMVGEADGEWDVDRLSQVFSNLIANALQHGRAGGGVEVIVDGTKADVVSVSVHNQGRIPHALLSKLFEPMAGGSQRPGTSSGLGLGLHITHEIVRAHGGSIDVQSDEPHGTMFTVSLPRHRKEPHP